MENKNSNRKPYRFDNIRFTTVFAIFEMAVLIAVAYFSVALDYRLLLGLAGGGILLAAVTVLFGGRVSAFFLYFAMLVNTSAIAFALAAYLSSIGAGFALVDGVLWGVAGAALFSISDLLSLASGKRSVALAFLSVMLVALILHIVLWAMKINLVLTSLIFFILVFVIFLFASRCISPEGGRKHKKFFVIGHFSAAIIAAIVALVVISEGDVIDGADFDIGGSKKKAKEGVVEVAAESLTVNSTGNKKKKGK